MLLLRDVARELSLQFFRERGGGGLNVRGEDFEQERQSSICAVATRTGDGMALFRNKVVVILSLTTDWLKCWGGLVPCV